MKAAALLLCGLALVAAVPYTTKQADKQFLQRQQDLLQLFVNLQQANSNQEQEQQAKSFSFQQQKENSNNQYAVEQFQNAYQQGYLPRGEVFNYYNPTHLQQAIQLFDLFYFAKDYATFYQAVCWARNQVNEGMLLYSLSVAILNRPDTQGIVIPPLSEVNPYKYINTQAVQQAQYTKQQGQKQVIVQSNNTDYYNYYQQQQQQQQQQPQEYPYTSQYQYNDMEQYTNQYQQQYQYNQEGRASYYSEDVHLNQQFAYEQLKNPAWFASQKYKQPKQQFQNNGENFYYYLQQILARYNLERYANNVPSVQPFQFNQEIQPGYNPQLQYPNGKAMPPRPQNYHIKNANTYFLEQLETIDRRIADVVDSHQVQAVDNTQVQLAPENGVSVLGNIVQNNGDSVNNQYYAAAHGFYGYLDQCRRVVGSLVNPNYENGRAAAAVEMDDATNRDPAFYQCVSRIINYFQMYKNQQKSYNQEQLNFQGVKIQSVTTDKLITYFDNAEVELHNAINYQQGEQPHTYQYVAQQQQLNYKPFNYQIQVDSDKNTDAIVRVFIGPKYNIQGQQISLEQARQYFVEIDRFTTTLKSGQNTIQHSSQQSTRFVQQQPNTRQLYNQIQQAQQGSQAFYYDQYASQQQAAFPQNLMLPKGSRNGQEYVLIVTIHQYQGSQPEQQGQQYQPYDSRSQGFPFDRVVREAEFQHAQNIHFQTVKVFNKNQSEVNNVEQ